MDFLEFISDVLFSWDWYGERPFRFWLLLILAILLTLGGIYLLVNAQAIVGGILLAVGLLLLVLDFMFHIDRQVH